MLFVNSHSSRVLFLYYCPMQAWIRISKKAAHAPLARGLPIPNGDSGANGDPGDNGGSGDKDCRGQGSSGRRSLRRFRGQRRPRCQRRFQRQRLQGPIQLTVLGRRAQPRAVPTIEPLDIAKHEGARTTGGFPNRDWSSTRQG